MAFGGGLSGSLLHPAVAVLVLLVTGVIFFAPRQYIVGPVLAAILLTPPGQQVYVGGLHVFASRMLLLAGGLRLLTTKISTRGDCFLGGINKLDKVFLGWALCRASATVILFKGETGALINQFGFLWDALGGYFVFRFLVHDEADIGRATKALAVVVSIVGVEMLREHFTGQDMFGALGGVRAVVEVRNGTPRGQGPFGQSLLAGTFGATVVPLFFWAWQAKRGKLFALSGLIGSTLAVFTAGCSTPMLAFVAAMGFKYLWPLRRHMRTVRRGIVVSLVAMQCVMTAPVWFVIAHIDLAGGSSGWDRANLIDSFIRHFFDWWLVGTNENALWGADTWDQCNQFVAEGENGGIATFVCFVLLIVIGFKWTGLARRLVDGERKKECLFWGLSIALFTHVVGFFGIDYFDQTRFAWYALIAMIAAATAPVIRHAMSATAAANVTAGVHHGDGFLVASNSDGREITLIGR